MWYCLPKSWFLLISKKCLRYLDSALEAEACLEHGLVATGLISLSQVFSRKEFKKFHHSLKTAVRFKKI